MNQGTADTSTAVSLVERTLTGLHTSLIARLPSIRRDAPVLDVGCGTGAWLQRLSQEGYTNLWGVDRDVSAVGCQAARIAAADLDHDAFPFGDQRFQLITAIEVIEHLENPGRLYNFARHFLAEDGHFLLTTPNMHSLVSRLRYLLTGRLGQFDQKGDPTHLAPLLLEGVERILPRHGLKIVARWGYPERGSIIYRRPLELAARVLGLVLPDEVPGDALCLLLGRSR